MSAGADTIDVEAFDQTLLTREFGEALKLLPKINLEAPDSNGNTYLMRACDNNEADVFEWLVQNGANINVKDKSGRNLLFSAIQIGKLDIVKWLVNNKRLLNTIYNGQTPLHVAVSTNQIEMVKVLVAAGLDSEVQNQDRDTSLDLAQLLDDNTILRWLIMQKSFEILDEALYEEGKVAALEGLFSKYGYQYLSSKFTDRNLTIAQYAADMQQIKVLKWLKSKMIPVDETLLTGMSNASTETFNILLVGEAGVEKSMFINAFMNYLNFKTLEQAEKAKSIYSLIPLNFTVTDENFRPQIVKFGSESITLGVSAAQSATSYVFETGDVSVRLIDTPSVGDTRGINKDEENFDRLLTVIEELKDIHGICIMLKPNNARLTVAFEYCVKQLLSRLPKDASQNIMFLYTNSRSSFYRPGDTITPLLRILREIKSKPPFINIPFGKDNVFSLDNEDFRFLIAIRNNIDFDDDEKDNFAKSWTKSTKVCIQLLKYIKSLKPHKIQETVSLNEARHLILGLKSVAKNIDKKIPIVNAIDDEYRNEMKIIQESMAKFAHFLKNNAITPYNDIYHKYIEYLIHRERSMYNGGDTNRIENYQKLILTYESYKTTLETQLAMVQESDPNQKDMVSAEDVTKLVQELYKLPLSGKTIKDFYDAQKTVVSAEILTNTERTVRPRIEANTTSSGWFCRTHNIFC